MRKNMQMTENTMAQLRIKVNMVPMAQLIDCVAHYILGNQHLSGVGKSHYDKGQQVQNISSDRYGGQTGASYKLSHYYHVNHVINSLQQVREHQGRGKHQESLADSARGEVPY